MAAGASSGDADAVLGPAEDGGWWALGLRDPGHAEVLRDIPTSTADTGAATLRRCAGAACGCGLLPVLRDVDTAADAHAVAALCPGAAVRPRGGRPRAGGGGMTDRDDAPSQRGRDVFDAALRRAGAGRRRSSSSSATDGVERTGRRRRLVPRTRCPATRRCSAAAPGRPSTSAAARAGSPRPEPARASRARHRRQRRGRPAGPAAGRDGAAPGRVRPLPGHGRWRHLLLADGNVGIGGDPRRLLRRCRELLGPDGRLHAELAPPGTRGWSGQREHPRGDGSPDAAPFRWAAVAARRPGRRSPSARPARRRHLDGGGPMVRDPDAA